MHMSSFTDSTTDQRAGSSIGLAATRNTSLYSDQPLLFACLLSSLVPQSLISLRQRPQLDNGSEVVLLRSTDGRGTVRMFEWPMNTSSAEITAFRVSVPCVKSAVANTGLTASARSAVDAQANTTAAASALVVKRRAENTTVTVPAPYVRCVASAWDGFQSMSAIGIFRHLPALYLKV